MVHRIRRYRPQTEFSCSHDIIECFMFFIRLLTIKVVLGKILIMVNIRPFLVFQKLIHTVLDCGLLFGFPITKRFWFSRMRFDIFSHSLIKRSDGIFAMHAGEVELAQCFHRHTSLFKPIASVLECILHYLF